MSGIVHWVVRTGANGFTLGGVVSVFANAIPKYLSAENPVERSDDIGINIRVSSAPGYKPTGVQRDAVVALFETWRRKIFGELGIECVEYHTGEVVIVDEDKDGNEYVGYVIRDSADVAHIRRLNKHGNVQHVTLSPAVMNFAVYKDLPYDGEKGMVLAACQHWDYPLRREYGHLLRRYESVIAAHRDDHAFIRCLVSHCRLEWLMRYVDDPKLAFELLNEDKNRDNSIGDGHRAILVEKVDAADIPELFRLRRITFAPVAIKAMRRLDQGSVATLFRTHCLGNADQSFESYVDALDPDTARALHREGLGVYKGANPWTDTELRNRLAARFAAG